MNTTERPVSIIALACLYIAVGTLGFVGHFSGLQSMDASRYDGLWIELVELVAILSGVFMLRRQNWARWLALAWIALHVVLSAFHSYRELAMHSVLCAVIAWILFRPEAARYFRSARDERT